MEFLMTNELAILRWVHILAMVYWLGGEWGVFQTSYHTIFVHGRLLVAVENGPARHPDPPALRPSGRHTSSSIAL